MYMMVGGYILPIRRVEASTATDSSNRTTIIPVSTG